MSGAFILAIAASYVGLPSEGTWFRVLVWITIGVLVYLLYGRTHSSLRDAVYVPAADADKIFRGLRRLA